MLPSLTEGHPCDKRRSFMVRMRIRHDDLMALTPWNAFVEVCRTGSIRAAAEATGFTQPGLSRQVAALEREVGVRLLHRGSRGVTPTAAGAALLPHARLVVNEVRRGREAARTATDRPATILLGAVPSATAALVPGAIGRLRDAGGPDVMILSRITPELGPMVVGRELDAAVVTDAPPGLPRDPELRAIHLGDDEVVVIAVPGHPLSGRGRVDLKALGGETWIEDNAGSEVMLRQLAARAGFEPRISTMADDLLAKTGMVAAGLGVAIVPDLLLPSLRPDLAILRLRRPAYRGIYLISRRERTDLGHLVEALTLGLGEDGEDERG
jgi:DNA-binding transcriptional LysR family regulator